MKTTLLFSVILGLYASASATRSLWSPKRPWELQLIRNVETGECQLITARDTQVARVLDGEQVFVTKLSTQDGHDKYSIIAYSEEAALSRASSLCAQDLLADPDFGAGQEILRSPHVPQPAWIALDIEPLITSGSSNNRVDLVFFSDGYTLEERAKFFEDAFRLADDISNNHTFNTVKPLLNFWAAFVPSNESGIGVGGQPKDTPFGLFRDGTELRGVYYSKPEVAREACLSLGDQCDFPILMGNDPLYGGLGGEFTVITPSLANGALVLRHELGHSVIDVGEEYDGGFAYFGVNAIDDLSQSSSWKHWLSEPSTIRGTETPRVERSVMPLQDYAWTLLNVTTPWAVNFSSSGLYARHLVRFSLSGLPDASDLLVELDGVDLAWKPRPDIGADRWHYDVHLNGSLADGVHEVKFTLRNQDLEGVAQLCSVEILEFGTEDEFVSAPGYYGLYPTFSLKNETTYRPTNEDCLMRVVTTPDFCKVCLEGLWLALLRRVELVEDIVGGCVYNLPSGTWRRTIDAELLPLAHLRREGQVTGESYKLSWFKDGQELRAFANQTHVEIDDAEGPGRYSLIVQFHTDEVLVDKYNLLRSEVDFTVATFCSE